MSMKKSAIGAALAAMMSMACGGSTIAPATPASKTEGALEVVATSDEALRKTQRVPH